MDEYNREIDPDISRIFFKIIRSFSLLFIWMMAVMTAGIFFSLGDVGGGWRWFNVLFYFLSLVTFIWLMRKLYRLWK